MVWFGFIHQAGLMPAQKFIGGMKHDNVPFINLIYSHTYMPPRLACNQKSYIFWNLLKIFYSFFPHFFFFFLISIFLTIWFLFSICLFLLFCFPFFIFFFLSLFSFFILILFPHPFLFLYLFVFICPPFKIV